LWLAVFEDVGAAEATRFGAYISGLGETRYRTPPLASQPAYLLNRDAVRDE
jgi:hypothetical protein